MSFFSKWFSKKQSETPMSAPKQPEASKQALRYQILEQDSGSYHILDTKENIKLGLHISRSTYDAGTIPHEDYPDENKNGCTTYIDGVIGDYLIPFPYEQTPHFTMRAEVRDNSLDRLANYDDTDFKMLNLLQTQMADASNPLQQQQAYLTYTLLKVVDSQILTSGERVTEEYRAEQKAKKQAKLAQEAKERQERQEAYRKAEEARIHQEKMQMQKKKSQADNYLKKILNEAQNWK